MLHKCIPAFVAVGATLLATSCAAIGFDRPEALEKDYETRERAAMEADDRCGPQFIQSKLPAGFVSVAGKITDGPFRPVCARHDACYRLGEKPQSWCDERMKTEMESICASGKATKAYSAPMIGKSLCRFHAGIYYTAINNTYGAYAYGGLPGGEIVGLSQRAIDDVLTDDEFEVCALVKNTTDLIQEYDVELHDSKGRLIDREPDTFETNVGVGETKKFCVGTNFTPRFSLRDLSEIMHVSVRADTPENFAFRDDMVTVDVVDVVVR